MKISKCKSQFLDDLLPGFDSLRAWKGIYSSERNDVEKQTTVKAKYYSGQYVNWTELARRSNMHKLACVFLPEF